MSSTGHAHDQEPEAQHADVASAPVDQAAPEKVHPVLRSAVPVARRTFDGGDDPLGGTAAGGDVTEVLRRRRGRGDSLPGTVAQSFGQKLGTPLDDVRVHHDAEADTVARSMQATAFTFGTDVYFTRGTYDPHSKGGQHLLAHELAHVSQHRRGGGGGSSSGPTIGRADDPAEAEADRIADGIVAGMPAPGVAPTTDAVRRCRDSHHIHRQIADPLPTRARTAVKKVKDGAVRAVKAVKKSARTTARKINAAVGGRTTARPARATAAAAAPASLRTSPKPLPTPGRKPPKPTTPPPDPAATVAKTLATPRRKPPKPTTAPPAPVSASPASSAAPPAPKPAHQPGTGRKHRPFQVQKLGRSYAGEVGTRRDDLATNVQKNLNLIAGYWQAIQILSVAAPEPAPSNEAAAVEAPRPVAPPTPVTTSSSSSSSTTQGGAGAENENSHDLDSLGSDGGGAYAVSEGDNESETPETENENSENLQELGSDGGGAYAVSEGDNESETPETENENSENLQELGSDGGGAYAVSEGDNESETPETENENSENLQELGSDGGGAYAVSEGDNESETPETENENSENLQELGSDGGGAYAVSEGDNESETPETENENSENLQELGSDGGGAYAVSEGDNESETPETENENSENLQELGSDGGGAYAVSEGDNDSGNEAAPVVAAVPQQAPQPAPEPAPVQESASDAKRAALKVLEDFKFQAIATRLADLPTNVAMLAELRKLHAAECVKLRREDLDVTDDGTLTDPTALENRTVEYDTDADVQAKTLVTFEGGKLHRSVTSGNPGPADTADGVTHFSGAGWEIFVVSTDNEIHMASHKIGKFHHSSLLGGKEIAMAGELKVEAGKVVKMSAKSGHYKPSRANCSQFLHWLEKDGIPLDFQFSTFDTKPMPADKFLLGFSNASSKKAITSQSYESMKTAAVMEAFKNKDEALYRKAIADQGWTLQASGFGGDKVLDQAGQEVPLQELRRALKDAFGTKAPQRFAQNLADDPKVLAEEISFG